MNLWRHNWAGERWTFAAAEGVAAATPYRIVAALAFFKGGSGPDYAKAATDSVYADLTTSPFTYLINAVSKTGGKITLDGKTYDFTGQGDADTTKITSDKMAAALLEMQKKYGSQYVQQRLNELQASDPEGQAARKQLYQATIASLNAPPNEQAATLDKLIQEDLAKGGELSAGTRTAVQQSVRAGQAARGNVLGNANEAQEVRAVSAASDAQRDARQQQALSYLTSGVSPEDVEYRRVQQAMGNLGNFISGTTPTAEFAGVSSAGNGAAPFAGGGPNAYTVNPNAGVQGAQNAQQQFQMQSSYDRTQANPWLAGAQLGIQGMNAYQSWQQPRSYNWTPAATAAMNANIYNPSTYVDTPSTMAGNGAFA